MTEEEEEEEEEPRGSSRCRNGMEWRELEVASMALATSQ